MKLNERLMRLILWKNFKILKGIFLKNTQQKISDKEILKTCLAAPLGIEPRSAALETVALTIELWG